MLRIKSEHGQTPLMPHSRIVLYGVLVLLVQNSKINRFVEIVHRVINSARTQMPFIPERVLA